MKTLKQEHFVNPWGTQIIIKQTEEDSKSELRYNAERIVNGQVWEGCYRWNKKSSDLIMLEWEYFEKKLLMESEK